MAIKEDGTTMVYIISVALGLLVFGLLAFVLVLKEKRALKQPTLESCGHAPTCQCQGQRNNRLASLGDCTGNKEASNLVDSGLIKD